MSWAKDSRTLDTLGKGGKRLERGPEIWDDPKNNHSNFSRILVGQKGNEDGKGTGAIAEGPVETRSQILESRTLFFHHRRK